MIEWRPLRPGDTLTCDWGGCDGWAVVARYAAVHGFLPVCGEHAQGGDHPGLTDADMAAFDADVADVYLHTCGCPRGVGDDRPGHNPATCTAWRRHADAT